MRATSLAIFCAAGALLSACGDSKTTRFSDADGNDVTVTSDSDASGTTEYNIRTEDGEAKVTTGNTLAGDLPLGLKPYPGAEILSSSISKGNGQSGGMVMMQTDDSQDAVLDHYRKAIAAQGLKVETEISSGDMKAIASESKDGAGVTIQATKVGDQTQILLIAGMGS